MSHLLSSIALMVSLVLLDQASKALGQRVLGANRFSLGPLGCIRVQRARIWLWRGRRDRVVPARTFAAGWVLLWSISAAALLGIAAARPECAFWCAALAGGSLSHALEMSARGWVCDLVCLRFWPAFNLADVGIAVGATGVTWHLALLATSL